MVSPSCIARQARAKDVCTSIHGRAGPTTASRPSSERTSAGRDRPSASGTSSTTSSVVASRPGTSWVASGACGCPARPAPRAPRSSGRITAVSVRGGAQSARSAAAVSSGSGRAGEQQSGQPFQVARPHPAGGRQLVAVPGDAGGGQLVDVGEHQLGEPGQLLDGQPGRDGAGAHVPPGHPRPHPVGGQQGVHRAAAARLAPAELVRAVQRRADRRARVGAAARRRQFQEATEGQFDGVADDPAHVALEGIGVAGDLDDDLGDGRRRPRDDSFARMASATAAGIALASDGRHLTLFVRREQNLPARFTCRAQVIDP